MYCFLADIAPPTLKSEGCISRWTRSMVSEVTVVLPPRSSFSASSGPRSPRSSGNPCTSSLHLFVGVYFNRGTPNQWVFDLCCVSRRLAVTTPDKRTRKEHSNVRASNSLSCLRCLSWSRSLLPRGLWEVSYCNAHPIGCRHVHQPTHPGGDFPKVAAGTGF